MTLTQPALSCFSRRSFLRRSAAAVALVPETGRAFAKSADRSFDLIVAGGTVIDPFRNEKRIADVGISQGKIVAVAETLDRKAGAQVLDADGLLVSPGWIDLHAHVFYGVRRNAVHPDKDAGVYTGVTTLADPGGFVSDRFTLFRREIVEKSITRVLGFVNVSAFRRAAVDTSQASRRRLPIHGDWSVFNQELTIKTIDENRDVIKGVKVLSSVRHSGSMGITPTKLAVQAARETNTHVMAHIGMAPPLIQDVLNLLGRGDIITHSFKGFPSGLFHLNGRPVAELRRALKRGMRLDLGHGAGSFAWEAARHARAADIPLHAISTDLHRGSVKGPVWSYGRTMAKFLHLGDSIEDIVRMATLGPAQLIDQGFDLGSLELGTVADLTVFRVVETPTVLTDSLGNSETGNRDVEPVYCIRAGKLISDMSVAPRGEVARK